ncbi:MAG TPA: hypothetical protein VH762_18670 [Gemmatimonadaceae bacterium]
MVWAKAAVIALLGAFYLATAQSLFTFDHDMSLYLGLARALSRGEGFVFNGTFNDQVPPGLPVLLAPVAALTPVSDVRVFQNVVVVLGVLALYLTWVWARAARRPYPWLTALLVGLIPGFFSAATGRVYAEVPYLVASLAILWWAERAVDPTGRALKPITIAAVALCAVAVPALRTVGIALPAALVMATLHDSVRRRAGAVRESDWRFAACAIAAVSFGFIVVWSRVVAAKTSGAFGGGFAPSYMAHLTLRNAQVPDSGTISVPELMLRLPAGILRQGAHVAEMATGISWIKPLWLSPFILLVGVVIVVGWWRGLRREQPLAAWYALLFLGIIAIWPYDEAQRFLVPIAPLLVSFAFEGARSVFDFVASAATFRRRGVPLLLGTAALLAVLVVRPWSSTVSRQELIALAAWPILLASWPLFRFTLERVTAPRLGRILGGAWLAGFALANSYQIGRIVLARRHATPDSIRLVGTARASDWLARHAKADAVVMAGEYAAVHLRTDLRTVPLLLTGQADALGAALRCTRPDYVVITDSLPNPYTLPVEPRRLEVMINSGAGSFEEVARFPAGRIFKFVANGDPCPNPLQARR